MGDLGSLLDRGVTVVDDHPALVAVPLLTSFLAVDNVRAVGGFNGMHFGGKLPVAAPILDLWTFVALPATGVDDPSAVPLVLLPVYAAIRGVLAAGYLGCIRDALVGRPLAVGENVRCYGASLIGFELLLLGVPLALVPLARLSVLLLIPVLVVLLVGAYLFYGTPYLVVSDDEGLVAALEHSYRLAVTEGAYAAFFVALLLGGGLLSIVATAIVVNLGLAGVLLGAILAAPLAVTVNAAAMVLFLDVGRGAIPAARQRPEHRAEGR